MQKLDAPALAASLNALAETFDRKAIPPKALEMWFDTLREFPTEVVLALLHSWPKVHGKMPVPAEIWNLLNDRTVDAREQRLKAEKAERHRDYERLGATESGKGALKLIYDMLVGRPKPMPLEHWRKVMATPALPEISYEYARAALQRLERREDA
jgi:hypothetical protein